MTLWMAAGGPICNRPMSAITRPHGTIYLRRLHVWLLAQGWTASATAEALERDPHTIGRWASAFGEGGPAALIFEQTDGSPSRP